VKELLGGLALLAACALFFLEGGALLGVLNSSDSLAPRLIGALGLLGVGLIMLVLPIAAILILAGIGKIVRIPAPPKEAKPGSKQADGDA
jgi:hypothetical protein